MSDKKTSKNSNIMLLDNEELKSTSKMNKALNSKEMADLETSGEEESDEMNMIMLGINIILDDAERITLKGKK